jgi:sacsin
MNNLIGILAGKRWLWVGSDFVAADRVAFSTPANAAPYLYAVPPDLVCFNSLLRAFGVRSSFGTSDWASVLKQMAVETNVDDETKDTTPLSPSQLELALLLVQVLSDDTMRVGDLEIYAPDEHGCLALTTDLVYNDAPWLAKEGIASNNSGESSELKLIHPKISAGVGEKVGVKSLRLLLATTHSTEMDFGIQSQSFGQSESITRRLRHSKFFFFSFLIFVYVVLKV